MKEEAKNKNLSVESNTRKKFIILRCNGNRWGHLIVLGIIEGHLVGQMWRGAVKAIVGCQWYLSKYERLISQRGLGHVVSSITLHDR